MKMAHVTIKTANFDEEIKFYEDFAELVINQDMRPQMDLVFLAFIEGGTRVEIIGDPEAGDAGNENLSIGFSTTDAEGLRQDFIDRGLKPTRMISPNPHVKFFYVTDPAGVKVQFIEG
ncbi:MAG: VOC family protein [Firmicutes bacterium]|nr:VOC family protein [Bacillota bacterium]